MRQKERIADYWEENIGDREINVPWDDALTHCWCCGMEALLEKAHIIPKAFDGQQIPSNLLLFCRRCNSQNPETVYSEFFWLWIKGRKKMRDEWKKKYVESSIPHQEFALMFSNSLNDNDVTEIYSCFGEENYNRASMEFVRLHCRTKRYLPRYASSSAIMLYRFHIYSIYLLRTFKENPLAPEILRWFPHLNSQYMHRNFSEAEELEEVERIDEIIEIEMENIRN